MSRFVSRFVSGTASANVSSIARHDCLGSLMSHPDVPRSPINLSYVHISITVPDNHEARAGEIS